MANKKKQAKSEKPDLEEFKIRGAQVMIARLKDRETVTIDGRVAGYYRTPGGYLLKNDVYRHPAKTLREAVERYLEREPAK